MKKFLQALGVLVVVAGVSLYFTRATLWDMAKDQITADMFVSADTDAFDPGLNIGEKFPMLKAQYQGETVNSMGQFLADKGMIFIANRSVDW